jgi:hypothetical protein
MLDGFSNITPDIKVITECVRGIYASNPLHVNEFNRRTYAWIKRESELKEESKKRGREMVDCLLVNNLDILGQIIGYTGSDNPFGFLGPATIKDFEKLYTLGFREFDMTRISKSVNSVPTKIGNGRSFYTVIVNEWVIGSRVVRNGGFNTAVADYPGSLWSSLRQDFPQIRFVFVGNSDDIITMDHTTNTDSRDKEGLFGCYTPGDGKWIYTDADFANPAKRLSVASTLPHTVTGYFRNMGNSPLGAEGVRFLPDSIQGTLTLDMEQPFSIRNILLTNTFSSYPVEIIQELVDLNKGSINVSPRLDRYIRTTHVITGGEQQVADVIRMFNLIYENISPFEYIDISEFEYMGREEFGEISAERDDKVILGYKEKSYLPMIVGELVNQLDEFEDLTSEYRGKSYYPRILN